VGSIPADKNVLKIKVERRYELKAYLSGVYTGDKT